MMIMWHTLFFYSIISPFIKYEIKIKKGKKVFHRVVASK